MSEEELNIITSTAKEEMQEAISYLEKELMNIRAGKASPNMLNTVKVEYYGTMSPLNQVANVNTPDSQTISVQPFEKSLISEIEKAILNANLGFNPSNNGESVIISIPPLTEERRGELSKQAKTLAEDAKVAVRNDRKNANNEIKKLDISEDLQRNAEVDIQDLTDEHIKKIDEVYEVKHKEIMTV